MTELISFCTKERMLLNTVYFSSLIVLILSTQNLISANVTFTCIQKAQLIKFIKNIHRY